MHSHPPFQWDMRLGRLQSHCGHGGEENDPAHGGNQMWRPTISLSLLPCPCSRII